MRRIWIASALAVMAVSLLLSSCATIMKGTKEHITINSTPKGTVKVTGSDGKVYFNGSTPANPNLPRGMTYTVVVSVNGYKSKTVQITHGIEGWFFGNLLFGGIPGGAVDAIDGAMWKLEPSTINLQLATAMVKGREHLAFIARALNQKGKPEQLVLPLTRID